MINVAFDVSARYNLSLSQPSVCRHPRSKTIWGNLYQFPGNLLRYNAHVEIMFPIFSRQMLQEVVLPSGMADASTGYGLDIVWPFLLGFPQDKIGIVDVVCMYHPVGETLKDRIYDIKHPLNWCVNVGNDGDGVWVCGFVQSPARLARACHAHCS